MSGQRLNVAHLSDVQLARLLASYEDQLGNLQRFMACIREEMQRRSYPSDAA